MPDRFYHNTDPTDLTVKGRFYSLCHGIMGLMGYAYLWMKETQSRRDGIMVENEHLPLPLSPVGTTLWSFIFYFLDN